MTSTQTRTYHRTHAPYEHVPFDPQQSAGRMDSPQLRRKRADLRKRAEELRMQGAQSLNRREDMTEADLVAACEMLANCSSEEASILSQVLSGTPTRIADVVGQIGVNSTMRISNFLGSSRTGVVVGDSILRTHLGAALSTILARATAEETQQF